MNSWKMWRSFTHFAFKRGKAIWLVGTILLMFFAFALWSGLGIQDAVKLRDRWNDWIDPVVGFATLLVAILVWWGEARQDWLASLQCKLTAVFFLEGREVMRCERANLASEADIRALGQQLGLQMNHNQSLRINAPAIRSLHGEPEGNAQGEIYRHWTVEFPLLELPQVMSGAAMEEVLVWTPPFNEKPQLSRHAP